MAASDRANASVKDAVPSLVSYWKKAKIPVSFVSTWPEWKGQVTNSPTLLVLIPHTDTDTQLNQPTMEIGNNQWLTLDRLEKSYVL